MSAKTKILVLHKKEVLYAGIFTATGLFLIVLFLILFLPGRRTEPLPDSLPESQAETQGTASPSQSTQLQRAVSSDALQTTPKSGILQETLPSASFQPGIYKTELILGGQTIEVEAVLEKDRISSLRLVNMDEAITTMYPLLEPTMEHICKQVYETQSLDQLDLDSGARYTSLVLLEAIRCCLDKGSAD